MRTRDINSDPIRLRKVKRYGDYFIFWGAYNYPWTRLIAYPSNGLLQAIKIYSRFSVAMMAYSVSAFFRFRFGHGVTGVAMSVATINMLLGFNSNNILILFKPFMTFVNPVLPFFLSGEELYRFTFVEIHSKSLLIFTLLFSALTAIHTGMIYFKRGNEDASKRGESWIYALLSKFMLVNETFIQMIVEPALTILLGIAFISWGQDLWAGVYFILAGASVAYQQAIDAAYNAFNKSIIDM